jgi:DNA-binding beta-propeller fold protein YncE
MNNKTIIRAGGVLLASLVALWLGQRALEARISSQVQAPRFEVDPFWPQPLPNNWRLGSVIGVWADDQDNIWIIHRGSATLGDTERAAEFDPPQGECCSGAPPVLAFDREGNLLHAWGGPGQGYDWPESGHGIFVDHLGYVWIGANGAGDSHILKFTRNGEFITQYGRPNARLVAPGSAGQQAQGTDDPSYQPPPASYSRNSLDVENFGRVAKIFIDAKTNEAYIADGYFNRRVAVLDGNTGEMKRFWGAYGNVPDDRYSFRPQGTDDREPPQQFRGPVHCADLSSDGLVYVCDRGANRIQVFEPDGTFVKEAFYAPATLRSGSVWDVAFSRDPEQRFLFIADGVNEKIRIVDRETLVELTNFGGGGRQPGQFYGVHSVATDSKGNVYTTETYEGKRLQKFVNMGLAPVQEVNQGVPWPKR